MVVLVAWDQAVFSIEFVSDHPIIMPKQTNLSRPYWNKRSTSPFNDFWFYCLNVDLKSRDLKVYRGFLQVLKWIISKGLKVCCVHNIYRHHINICKKKPTTSPKKDQLICHQQHFPTFLQCPCFNPPTNTAKIRLGTGNSSSSTQNGEQNTTRNPSKIGHSQHEISRQLNFGFK